MPHIYVIHGEESQLIEEEKAKLLRLFDDHIITTFTRESSIDSILSNLLEDSLFGDSKVILLQDIPLLPLTTGKKTDATNWQVLYETLLDYQNENPVIVTLSGRIDNRIKSNKAFLALPTVQEHYFPKLAKEDLLSWSETYCRTAGHPLTGDAKAYLFSLLDLWVDVPVTFLKTEFDRLFLLLPPKGQITGKLIAHEGSDYGSKNIFKFTEALFDGDIKTLWTLLPFVSSTKEIDRFLAYLQGQLRLQLIVLEMAHSGRNANRIYQDLVQQGYSVKQYPVKLAYERCRKLTYKKLRLFLYGLYDLTLQRRTGNSDPNALERLCIAYVSA